MNAQSYANSTDVTRLDELVTAIATLPQDWHGAGTVSVNVLRALVRHAPGPGPVQHSIETGTGRTTLLLSHLSKDHTVFALDLGQSITQVRKSPLLNAAAVTFVEGPTQRTLPIHTFAHKHQLVLIDGPHAYPFPDVEYFYLYPTIDTGGLLAIDDILIPSIRRMYEIVKADKMFRLLEVVDDNMAIFRRTDAPAFDREGDGWWTQDFNRSYYEQLLKPQSGPPVALRQLFKGLDRAVPQTLRRMLPRSVKKTIWRNM